MISRDSRAATWDFPCMMAQLSYHVPNGPATQELRAAQASLWKDGLALEGPNTDMLTGANRQNRATAYP